ncbi:MULTISPECIES: DUF3043 domain-containing protein [unclassified Streptomyces]|uniref:DUF3043 domain-containing protein n=1 Tax=unclassified Streptomyces TaxID=2593676 RepID=UPI00190B37B4|nr:MULTISPECIES: DUF3043 domain-containing protein [unclassified Streptomyces]MBK3570753.1 DUF3043 domain-containing protein [Streptomyces sp. MBT62]MBK6017195.1 DUF3043 domain-containing protein [Streptomyces sp. MBT53]
MHPVSLGFVFRSRAKEEKAATADQASPTDSKQPRDPQAPKGRPTPKRSESQTQRRSVANTTLTRKDASKRQRDERRVQMEKQRSALAGRGNERDLPLRDRGPIRKFARDYIDARFNVAEFFLPMAVVILVLSVVQVPALQNIALLLWLVIIILIVVDSFLNVFRLRKQLAERFPGQDTKGTVWYAMMRSLQMRRLRLPKPQVKRGEKP